MAEPLLVDTDILIDCLRGRSHALTFLQGQDTRPFVSAASVAELYAGVRDEERSDLQVFLSAFRVAPVSEEIARAGGLYRRDFGPSHGSGLVDGIIAATAAALDARLATLNRRRYPMLNDVLVPY